MHLSFKGWRWRIVNGRRIRYWWSGNEGKKPSGGNGGNKPSGGNGKKGEIESHNKSSRYKRI